jgi:hypothetical protein
LPAWPPGPRASTAESLKDMTSNQRVRHLGPRARSGESQRMGHACRGREFPTGENGVVEVQWTAT